MRGFSLLAILFTVSGMPAKASATDFHLYFLGGQSNMEGYGSVEKLPPELANVQSDVLIFHGNPAPDGSPAGGRGVWTRLGPGHGHPFRSDGVTSKYSDRFGIELTFARQIARRFPDRRIAILKYANGGTSLDPAAAKKFGCCAPEFEQGNQFDHFLKALQQAKAEKDIDGDDEPDRLIPAGIVWMQGESDANHTLEIANRYRSNLNRVLHSIRQALGNENLNIALGRVSPSQLPDLFWKHLDLIRTAQTDFAREDGNTTLITSSDEYGFSDFWHYDAQAYLELGREFGDALADLELRGTENNDSP